MKEVCYLCGRLINKRNRTRDHIPAKQIFPTRIRKKFNLSNLVSLPACKDCNEKYQQDEDYFFQTIGAVDDGNDILKEVWYDISERLKKPECLKLNLQVLNQFTDDVRTPGGINIPNAVAMQYKTARIDRVIWKITRGLYFIKFGKVLRADKQYTVNYIHGEKTGLDEKPVTQLWSVVRTQEEHGAYGRVFSFKCLVIPGKKMITAWGLLFWDRHLFMIIHHNPDCNCDKCKKHD